MGEAKLVFLSFEQNTLCQNWTLYQIEAKKIQLFNSFHLIYDPIFDIKYFNSKLEKTEIKVASIFPWTYCSSLHIVQWNIPKQWSRALSRQNLVSKLEENEVRFVQTYLF